MSCKCIAVIGIVLTLLLSGCVKFNNLSGDNMESNNYATANSYNPEEEKTTLKQVEVFLRNNVAAMETLSEAMISCYEKGEILQYYPKEQCLYRYDDNSYAPQEKLQFHPIKEKAAFLHNSSLFDLVATVNDQRILESLHCEYCSYIYDEQGRLYSCICLIYCDNPAAEKGEFSLTEVLPHWYYLVEYYE